jgi:hypothetical protein
MLAVMLVAIHWEFECGKKNEVCISLGGPVFEFV